MKYCLKQNGMKNKWNTWLEVKIGPFLWTVSGQKSRKSCRWQDVTGTVVSGVQNTGRRSSESVTRGPWKGPGLYTTGLAWTSRLNGNVKLTITLYLTIDSPTCTDITAGKKPRTGTPLP